MSRQFNAVLEKRFQVVPVLPAVGRAAEVSLENQAIQLQPRESKPLLRTGQGTNGRHRFNSCDSRRSAGLRYNRVDLCRL